MSKKVFLSRNVFLPKFVKLANEGKTAEEIGQAFQPVLTASQVVAKASHLRIEVKKAAEAQGKSKQEVEILVNQIPTLTRARRNGSVLDLLSSLNQETETPNE